MDNKTSFFILYPRISEEEVKGIVDELNYRLSIDYKLWSYAAVQDEEDYFDRVLQPEVERADFILAMVAKDTANDNLLKKACKCASDNDKQVIPIKIGKGRVKSKDWAFRTEFVDFYNEEERIRLIEHMHGLLGKRRVGDIYGSKVTLGVDVNASVIRNDELMGNASPENKLVFNLAKGTGEFKVQTGNNWNEYIYYLPTNDEKVDFDATLKDNIMLSNTPKEQLMFDPLLGQQPKWDVTDRSDFKLNASSEDDKKKNVIFNSFERCYKATIRPCPEYDMKEFRHRYFIIFLMVVFCIVLSITVEWYVGIIVFAVFMFLRRLRKKQLLAWNRRKKRKLQERFDNFNISRWAHCLSEMNNLLESQGLEKMTFANLGTPDSFIATDVDTNGYARKAYELYNEKNYDEALKWYRYAAEEGSDYAQNALGNMYYSGEGVPVDYEKAVEWYRLAATQEEMYAQYNLGNMYYYGRGVRKDHLVALKWYERSAEQGHAEAQEKTAELYQAGKDGVNYDAAKSAIWFGKAAAQGLAASQYHYGRCLETGRGVKRNYSEAAAWYTKAAEAGVTDAMRRLGYLYKKGRGVSADKTESQRWYQLAEGNNSKA